MQFFLVFFIAAVVVACEKNANEPCQMCTTQGAIPNQWQAYVPI